MEIINEGAAYALAGPGAQTFMIGSAQVRRSGGTAVVITEAEENLGNEAPNHRREFVDKFVLSRLSWVPDERTRRFLKDDFEGLVCRVLLWTPEGLLDLGGGKGDLREMWDDHVVVVRLDVPASQEALGLERRLLVRPVEPAPTGWLEHVHTERPRALRELVEGWFPRRLRPSWRLQEQAPPQVPVPKALAGFYGLAHDHPALLEKCDYKYLHRPAELNIDQAGKTILGWGGGYEEGPGWKLVPGKDDPQVLACDHVDLWPDEWDDSLCGWRRLTPWREREPLSGFLLQFALYAAAAYGPYQAVASELSRRQALELVDGWQRVPLQPLLAEWEPVTFAVAPGRIACLYPGPPEESDPDADDCWVNVAATHPDLLNPLDIDWYTFIG